jgi:hypothetical protein
VRWPRKRHRGTDELLEEAVDHLVTWNEWFERKIGWNVAATERMRSPDAQILPV